MPSKFLERAKRVIREHRRVFEALEEYDRTRKMPRTVYRERINLTINGDLLKRFRRHSQEKGLNMSRVIESYIKKELGLK